MSAPDTFFGGKTGTLGWAMGAALGVQLAYPGRKVVATVGDGDAFAAVPPQAATAIAAAASGAKKRMRLPPLRFT